ncbi:MAG: C40 family peptidase [Lachnospiraceae bacterium]|nr:C40 family peptidase [Candidatus Equihabitans merdae]
MTVSLTVPVMADRESDLQAAVAANNSALAATRDTIDQKTEEQNALKNEIAELDSQLVTVMSNIDVLKNDISSTEEQIVQKTEDLKVAQSDQDEQYAAMGVRIQYIYENGGNASWLTYIFQAEDLSDFLNRADYTRQLEDYDREMLTNFMATVAEVKDIKQNLELNKAMLEEEEVSLEEQQAQLNTLLEEKKVASANYDQEIASLQSEASALSSKIAEQNAEIRRIQEEKAEAARRAAEEAAKAAEAAAAQQAAAQQNTASNNDNGGQSSQQESSQPAQSSSSGSSSSAPSAVGGGVVGYACQFVGNPYVWGGSDPHTGAACSGFVAYVFGAYGYDLPHSSGAIAGCGRGVYYSDIPPGDIICYPGHVAIYVGGDTVVHAASESQGICYTSPAIYRSYTTIRRLG